MLHGGESMIPPTRQNFLHLENAIMSIFILGWPMIMNVDIRDN